MVVELSILEIAQIISALTAPILAYVYYQMLNVQREQNSIQKSQQEIMSQQQKLMSSQQTPIIQINKYDLRHAEKTDSVYDEDHYVNLSNVGNGVANNLKIRFEISFRIPEDKNDGPFSGIPVYQPMTHFGFQSIKYPLMKGDENSKYVSMDGGGVLRPTDENVSFVAPVEMMYFEKYVSPDIDPADITHEGPVSISDFMNEVPYDKYEEMKVTVNLHYEDASGQSLDKRLLISYLNTEKKYSGVSSLRDLITEGNIKHGDIDSIKQDVKFHK